MLACLVVGSQLALSVAAGWVAGWLQMDVEMIKWMEGELAREDMAVVLVTHDRWVVGGPGGPRVALRVWATRVSKESKALLDHASSKR